MKKATKKTSMKRINCELTALTIECLQQIRIDALNATPSVAAKINPLIERMLREHPMMIAARKKIGVREWDERPPAGRPLKSVKK